MSDDPGTPLRLSTGLPETVLPAVAPEAAAALEAALSITDAGAGRAAVAEVVARWPRYLDAWARLAELGRDPVERYAAARVGYHRGLDTLRQSGWRGSGYVRWEHPTNRGFLRALLRLAVEARGIGEHDEAERCETFLRQCDPTWPPADLG